MCYYSRAAIIFSCRVFQVSLQSFKIYKSRSGYTFACGIDTRTMSLKCIILIIYAFADASPTHKMSEIPEHRLIRR